MPGGALPAAAAAAAAATNGTAVQYLDTRVGGVLDQQLTTLCECCLLSCNPRGDLITCFCAPTHLTTLETSCPPPTAAHRCPGVLVCGWLVFFMQCGFALLEAGTVRLKNTKNICEQSARLAEGTVLVSCGAPVGAAAAGCQPSLCLPLDCSAEKRD